MTMQGHPADASRDSGELLIREHAALRRVALLVAQESEPADVFAVVAEEVSRLAPMDMVHMYRYEPDGTAVAVAVWSERPRRLEVGTRLIPGGHNICTLVLRSGRPARIDDGATITGSPAGLVRRLHIHSTVGVPIVVDGSLWGVMIGSTATARRMPPDAEERIGRFTELVAAAISNAQARAELRLLADEQAALRRVATLVAGKAWPAEIFTAVAAELARLLPAAITHLFRYEPDDQMVTVGAWSEEGEHVPVGTRMAMDGQSVAAMVRRSGRSARIDGYEGRPGPVAEYARGASIDSSVGSPVVVDGGYWGVMVASSTRGRRLAADAESRLADFAELVAIAISNAQAWAELAASRARVVAASDDTRRRIERDLHDGTQQRLVTLALELRAASDMLPQGRGEARERLAHVAEGINGVLDELREISRGLHPAILSEGGLRPALKSLARRSPLPIELELGESGRFPEPLEVAVYYLVSEALTNAARHSNASLVRVAIGADEAALRVRVTDDGVGGAVAGAGSGLLGLRDRVEALGGTFTLTSPLGQGTSLVAELPLAEPPGVPASR